MSYAIPDWANPDKIPDIYTTKAQQDLWQKRQRETRVQRIDEARRNRDPGTPKGSVLHVPNYILTDAELQSLLPPPEPKPEPVAPIPEQKVTPIPEIKPDLDPKPLVATSTSLNAPMDSGINQIPQNNINQIPYQQPQYWAPPPQWTTGSQYYNPRGVAPNQLRIRNPRRDYTGSAGSYFGREGNRLQQSSLNI